MNALTVALAGLVTGWGLIVAIGAQNAFVLRQGIHRSHVGPVIALCALSDVVLILAGVLGVGVLIQQAGWMLTVVRWAGVAFLVFYGVSSLVRARSAHGLAAAADGERSLGRTLAHAAALTWLNPHVYLDTVVMVGSIANSHGHPGRWWFAVGACFASIVWFTALGYGARALAPALARPRAWQVLDVVIGVTMLVIALALARG